MVKSPVVAVDGGRNLRKLVTSCSRSVSRERGECFWWAGFLQFVQSQVPAL